MAGMESQDLDKDGLSNEAKVIKNKANSANDVASSAKMEDYFAKMQIPDFMYETFPDATRVLYIRELPAAIGSASLRKRPS